MKKAIVFFSALILMTGVVSPARTADEVPAPGAGGTESLLLVREAWVVFVEEPSGYLQKAYAAFLRSDMETAQENLRKAGVFLFMQARWEGAEMRRELEDSLKELNSLIVGLEGEPTVRAAALRKAFARAEYRLALGHLLYTAGLLEQKSHGTAGYALDAAAAHLRVAALWLDEDLDAEDLLRARQARLLRVQAKPQL